MSDFNEYDEQGNESTGMKQLRQALEKAQRELKAANETTAALQKQVATQSLASILSAKKVPASIQKWITRDDIEATEEAVDKWLADNGSDFGWNPNAQKGPEDATSEEAPVQAQAPAAQSVLTEADVAALSKFGLIFDAQSGAPTMPADAAAAAVDSVASKVQTGYNATPYEDVVRGLREAGIDIGGNLTY